MKKEAEKPLYFFKNVSIMVPMTCGIYSIKNIINNKIYIGTADNTLGRYYLGKNEKENTELLDKLCEMTKYKDIDILNFAANSYEFDMPTINDTLNSKRIAITNSADFKTMMSYRYPFIEKMSFDVTKAPDISKKWLSDDFLSKHIKSGIDFSEESSIKLTFKDLGYTDKNGNLLIIFATKGFGYSSENIEGYTLEMSP